MLLRKTLLTMPAQVAGPLAQFVAAVVWTYWLTPAALGVYAIVWAVQELVLLLFLSWWSVYVLRYLTTHDGADERRLVDGLEIAVQIAAAALQTVTALAVLWLVLDIAPGANLIAATVAFTLTRNLTSHLADRARARFATGAYTMLSTIGPVLGLLFGLAAVAFLAPTPENVLWGYALAQALGLALALPFVRPVTLRPAADRALLVTAFAYGVPLMLGNVFSWVSTHSIRFIVEHDLGPAAVGLVSVGWWLGQRATTFGALLVLGAAFNVAVERMREGGIARALPQLATNGAMILTILVPMVAGIWLLNGPIVDALVAEGYREVTKDILPFAALAGALSVFRAHGSDQCWMLFERPRIDSYLAGSDAVLTVIACIAGLKLGGLTGAVVGCAAASTVSTVVSFSVANRMFGYHLRPGDLVRIGLATAVMAGAILVLGAPAGRIGLAVTIGAGAAVFFATLALLYPALTRRIGGAVLGKVALR